jgi:hypothetical protein
MRSAITLAVVLVPTAVAIDVIADTSEAPQYIMVGLGIASFSASLSNAGNEIDLDNAGQQRPEEV